MKRAKVISRCEFSPKKSISRNRKLKALVYDLRSSPAGVEVSRATLGVSNEAKLEGDSETRKLFLFFLDCSSNGPLSSCWFCRISISFTRTSQAKPRSLAPCPKESDDNLRQSFVIRFAESVGSLGTTPRTSFVPWAEPKIRYGRKGLHY